MRQVNKVIKDRGNPFPVAFLSGLFVLCIVYFSIHDIVAAICFATITCLISYVYYYVGYIYIENEYLNVKYFNGTKKIRLSEIVEVDVVMSSLSEFSFFTYQITTIDNQTFRLNGNKYWSKLYKKLRELKKNNPNIVFAWEKK